MQALNAQLKKALDPIENIKEIKEVVDLRKEIGTGAYGVVKKVSLHGTICAAKDIHTILINYASDKEFEHIKKSFLEECIKCSKLFHPNIVQFLGIHYSSKQAKLPWLVMELLDCSLTGFVEKYDKETVSLFVKTSIFCDISLGLQFLHSQNIIHRDLSSNNILLSKHLTAKIADLGVAKLVDPDGSKSHTAAPGTQCFLPPDVFSVAAKSHYGKPIDVFSLGCIMIHVTTHEWPVPLPETYFSRKINKKVVLSEVERREAYINQIQGLQDLKILIENCLHDDSEIRPSINKMIDDLEKLRLIYQKNSSFAGNEMNAVEFEMKLKSRDKMISEQVLEIEKLNKTIQDTNKLLQVRTKLCSVPYVAIANYSYNGVVYRMLLACI